jgi:peroxiredoxin
MVCPQRLASCQEESLYAIDKQGVVKYIFNSQTHPEQHVKEVLKVL